MCNKINRRAISPPFRNWLKFPSARSLVFIITKQDIVGSNPITRSGAGIGCLRPAGFSGGGSQSLLYLQYYGIKIITNKYVEYPKSPLAGRWGDFGVRGQESEVGRLRTPKEIRREYWITITSNKFNGRKGMPEYPDLPRAHNRPIRAGKEGESTAQARAAARN